MLQRPGVGPAIAASALALTTCLVVAATASAGASDGTACTPGPRAACTGLSAPGAKLRGKNLRGIDLTGANLRRADLRGANLTGAKLVRTNLAGAKLDGADFSNAKILGATITDVSAVRTTWKGALFGRARSPRKTSNQSGAYNGTTVSGTHCGGDFRNAMIQNATFRGDYSYGTCGTSSDFSGSMQQSSNFTQANMLGVNLSNAHINLNNYSNQSSGLGTPLAGTSWRNADGGGNNFLNATFGTDGQGHANDFTGVYMLNCTCPKGEQGTFTNGPCLPYH